MKFKFRPFIFLLMGMSLLMGTVLLLLVLSTSCVYNSTSRPVRISLFFKMPDVSRRVTPQRVLKGRSGRDGRLR